MTARRAAGAWLCAALVIAAAAGCGDDDDGDGDVRSRHDGGGDAAVARDGSAPPRAGTGGAAGAMQDGSGAQPDAAQAGRDATSAEPPDPCASVADAGAGGEPLGLELPAEVPPGAPFVVAITSPSGASAEAQICLDGEVVAQARLYRGRGSASLVLDQAGERQLVVRAGSESAQRTLPVVERPTRTLTGSLSGDDLAWTADADIVLSGDVRVPAGQTLAVTAGTRVLLEPIAALEVEGELAVTGTAADPVLFTRAGQDPWGGIRILGSGATAVIEHAWLTGGGGDAARNFGHSDSQPLLWAEAATVRFSGGGIVDNTGKGLGSSSAYVTVQDALISRCDTGGQLNASQVVLERSHVLELPDADGRADDDDNDGLYLSGTLTDAEGAPLPSLIRDTVFAIGEDDGIDHNDAELRIEHVWIEGFRHEGLAASVGHEVTIADSVVRGCQQGIEAGYGSPQVRVEHCLVTDNDVGLRVGDSYDWDTSGSLTVRNTVSYGNRQLNVRNYVKQIDGPLAGAIDLACSLVDDPEYDGNAGNLAGAPDGDYALTGCVNGPALVAPECSDMTLGPRDCF